MRFVLRSNSFCSIFYTVVGCHFLCAIIKSLQMYIDYLVGARHCLKQFTLILSLIPQDRFCYCSPFTDEETEKQVKYLGHDSTASVGKNRILIWAVWGQRLHS